MILASLPSRMEIWELILAACATRVRRSAEKISNDCLICCMVGNGCEFGMISSVRGMSRGSRDSLVSMSALIRES